MGYKSSINTGLPNLPDPPDPLFFAEFARVYNAIRNLTIAVDKYCGTLPADAINYSQTPFTETVYAQNVLRLYVKFSEAVTYGQTINLAGVSGVVQARLSNATVSGRHIHGWCSTAGGVLAGAYGEVMLGGLCTAIGGLTAGSTYYTGNTAGTISNTAGVISQKIGYALSSSNLMMQPTVI